MIFGVTRKFTDQQRRQQEAIPALSAAIWQLLNNVELRIGREDCTGAWADIANATKLINQYGRQRTAAGLPSEGPFGARAARRLADLQERAAITCGGAIAYERR